MKAIWTCVDCGAVFEAEWGASGASMQAAACPRCKKGIAVSSTERIYPEGCLLVKGEAEL